MTVELLPPVAELGGAAPPDNETHFYVGASYRFSDQAADSAAPQTLAAPCTI